MNKQMMQMFGGGLSGTSDKRRKVMSAKAGTRQQQVAQGSGSATQKKGLATKTAGMGTENVV